MVPGPNAGFTGTRDGLTSFQRNNLMDLLVELHPWQLHHGDCVGADAEAHGLCTALQIPIYIHPPDRYDYRAYCNRFGEMVEQVYEEKPYLARNHDIVDETDYIIACVKGPENLHSGTWATVRYAYAQGKCVFILYPDGLVDRPKGYE